MILVEPLNIFDDIAIEAGEPRSRKPTPRLQTQSRTGLPDPSRRKWDEDPIFFEKFSKVIRDVIADFHDGRISEIAYLAKIRELRDKVQHR